MITTLLCDVGNVLLEFKPEQEYRKLFDDAVYAELMNLMFQQKDWHHFDQGLLSEADLKVRFIQKAPHLEKEINLVMKTYLSILKPITPMIEYVLNLKKAYRISILSNMPEVSSAYIEEHFPFLKEFEMPLYSYAFKLIKPDPEIYKTQLQRLGISANECLFIDDRIENIEAATSLGFHTVLMTTPDETIPKIEQLLQQNKIGQ